ncbi:MAG: Hsp33 family molecular chaperone HslO [Pseudomonadales bacterium]
MDLSRRFLFEATDIRGDIVQITQSYRDLVANHDYPAEVQWLLGEFVVAGLLLGSTIKFQGRLILQVRSQGAVPLLMVEITHDHTFRGIARLVEEADVSGAEFAELFAGGSLVVTVDPDDGERYQSLVPMDGANLAACLMHYFAQSEQLSTWLLLTADDHGAAGFLLQQLPKQLVQSDQQRSLNWEHVRVMGETLKTEELRTLTVEQILNRLYHDQKVRVLAEHEVRFLCSCSRERMASALVALGESELDDLFSDQAEVELTCEFCNNQFSFDRAGIYDAVTQG